MPFPESSLRKQGPIRRAFSIGCGVWVPACAGTAEAERQSSPCPSHRPENMRELGLELGPQIVADIDHDRERAGELLVVRDAGVDQNAIVEVAGQKQRIALGGP